MKKFLWIGLSFFSILFFITCLTTFVVYSDASFTTSSTEYFPSATNYTWPLLNYHTISSPFGFRISPITGTSHFHTGIDIPAPEETLLYATSSGIVTYLDFNGANGYTIMVQNQNTVFSYSHISPQFMVAIGDAILQNQPIATVGPAHIPPIPNNPYTDSNRKSNKWCYNWLSFAF